MPIGSRSPASLRAATGAILFLACTACTPPEPATEPETIEPVEIGAGPTAAMTAVGDAVAAASGESLYGALPGGFPEGLPLVEPASVLDFGTETDRFVVLRTTLTPDAAEAQLTRRLDAAGWQISGDPWTRSKGGERVRIRFSTGDVGETQIRIEY